MSIPLAAGRLPATLLVFTAAAAGWVTCARAKEEPLWTVGAGLGVAGFEDYRGSASSHAYPVPIPYIIYHGDFFKSDDKGVRGSLFNQDWVELNLSGNATAPGRNDAARFHMPNLSPTVELGPSFDFHLLRTADSRIRLDLNLPVRIAYTVESSPRFIGGTFNPSLDLAAVDPLGFTGWHAGFEAGPLFADSLYNRYFYSVAPQYATSMRPAYSAPGGYAGVETTMSLSKRFPKFWVGAYLRHDSLSGAVFDASPLVQVNHYWSMGIGISWIIGESSRMVQIPD